MELLRYLDNTFLTRTQLLEATGIDATAPAGLAGMPKPSYRRRLDVGCDSFFGAHAEQHQVDYRASGYSSWIGTLLALCAETDGRPSDPSSARHRGLANPPANPRGSVPTIESPRVSADNRTRTRH